tara:strand:- start:1885 stop:2841 length:957 start_codon:yes stop_codon:yes gene_type:complete
MKIINLLYWKYTTSLLMCFISSLIIFFIFSLIGNLNENYSFNVILKLSLLNSLQILTYIPAFIYLLSIILFTIFLKSKNEVIIIKSYFNLKRLTLFILPVVIIFTIIEINKQGLNLLIEDTKLNLIKISGQSGIKIFIKKNEISKNYILFKNMNLNNLDNAEYRSYFVTNNKINSAEFSNNLKLMNNSFYAEKFTQYNNNFIKDINNKRIIDINFLNLIQKSPIVKNISKKNNLDLNFKLINLIIFFILFFIYVFLFFFSSKYVSTKQSLKYPIFVCLIILLYSFIIFNNSLSFYKHEFEMLASVIVGMFFIKVYLNE